MDIYNKKLDPDQVRELIRLYVYQGWNEEHLRRKYKITQQSVHYYVKKYKLEHLVPVLTKPPEEIRFSYKGRMPRMKSYRQYLEEQRKQADCEHHKYFLKCSVCGKVMGSEVSVTCRPLSGV